MMLRVRDRPVEFNVHQWHKNGDHPLDGDPSTEGEIVRYYRNPTDDGHRKCRKCGNRMHDHGWLDTEDGGQTVCPGDWVLEAIPCGDTDTTNG